MTSVSVLKVFYTKHFLLREKHQPHRLLFAYVKELSYSTIHKICRTSPIYTNSSIHRSVYRKNVGKSPVQYIHVQVTHSLHIESDEQTLLNYVIQNLILIYYMDVGGFLFMYF